MRGSLSSVFKQVSITVLAVLLVGANGAGAVNNGDLQDTERKLEDVRSKIRRGDTEKKTLNDQIRSADQKLAVIDTELKRITDDLNQTKQTKDRITANLNALKLKLERTQKSLDRATKKLQRLTEILNRRAGNFYKNGDISFIEVLLRAEDFNDFVSRVRFLHTVVELDAKLVREIKTTRSKIIKSREIIVRAKKQTEEQEDRLVTEVNRLATLSAHQLAKRQEEKDQKQAKKQAVAKIDQDQEAWMAAADEFERSAALIRSQLSRGKQVSGTPSTTGFIWPASGPVSSGFGPRWGRMHNGVDISVPTGSPVVASKAGTVRISSYYGGYGNLIVIDHGGGVETWYGHNSTLVAGVGTQVGRGAIVARAGSTGHSTGPHVHFEVRINGAPRNPANYLP